MTAPIYINRSHNQFPEQSLKVEAVQFIVDNPRTHWHVNFGHPKIETLKDLYWVHTIHGPVEIADRQWVVKNDLGISIFNDQIFSDIYQPEEVLDPYTFVRPPQPNLTDPSIVVGNDLSTNGP